MRVQDIKMCSTCGKVKKKMSFCSKCNHVHYCSAECQRQGWQEHKPLCKKLLEWGKRRGETAGKFSFFQSQLIATLMQVRSA